MKIKDISSNRPCKISIASSRRRSLRRAARDTRSDVPLRQIRIAMRTDMCHRALKTDVNQYLHTNLTMESYEEVKQHRRRACHLRPRQGFNQLSLAGHSFNPVYCLVFSPILAYGIVE